MYLLIIELSYVFILLLSLLSILLRLLRLLRLLILLDSWLIYGLYLVIYWLRDYIYDLYLVICLSFYLFCYLISYYNDVYY